MHASFSSAFFPNKEKIINQIETVSKVFMIKASWAQKKNSMQK